MLNKKVFLFLFVLLLTTILTGCGAGNQPLSTNNSSSAGGGTGTATGTATLSWDVPTTNADGTPLTDLAGFKVYYGNASGNYTTIIDVGNITTYVVSNLSPGPHYFTVTAYNISGYESDYSIESSKTIQ
jgi:hypothetical protein